MSVPAEKLPSAAPAAAPVSTPVTVSPVRGKKELEEFLHVPWTLGMKGDPNWVPPLLDDYRRLLDPRKSPFLAHGELECFVAREGGRIAGRISAQIDRIFDEHWKGTPEHEGVAFFGFFDCADRPEVARALFDAASTWARSKGRTRLRGPFSLDSKGEMGVLIDGFDTPPRIGMTHNKPYVGALIEKAGLHKCKDLYAWWYTPGAINELTKKMADRTRANPSVKIRPVSLKDFRREVDVIREVYNSAWSKNWGFTPFTDRELEIIAKEYKMFVDPEIALVAEIDGKPAAICFAIPDVNEMIRDFDGELGPVNVAKLLYRNSFNRPKNARLILLGIKEEFRASHKYGTLAAALYVEVAERGAKRGYKGGELSWTLEDNVMINRGIERMGARKYKTYRLYETAL